MTITAQEVLSFLSKANRLAINYTIEEADGIGYDIKLYYNWNNTEKFSFRYVFIPNEGCNQFQTYYNFEDANDILDARLEEKRVKEEKERRRNALLERLTAEERELLGV